MGAFFYLNNLIRQSYKADNKKAHFIAEIGSWDKQTLKLIAQCKSIL